MILPGCAAPVPQEITKVVTQVVEKTVKETVVVQTTPQVVEKVVEKVVTAAPPAATATKGVQVVAPPFKNPDTYVVITGAGEPETLDPAWTYETAGSAVEANIYDGLVWYNREKYDDFVPALATAWKLSPDGLKLVFNIRKGITFHEGGTLEPHDVAYTNQRAMLQGRIDGPQGMIYELFFGSALNKASIKDFATALIGKDKWESLQPADLVKVCEDIKKAVVADDAAGTVTYNLKQPAPWFLALATGNFLGGILDSEWMKQQGDWDGDCATWSKWADPPAEATVLFRKANGTGPYKLDHWTPGEEIVLTANEKYWRTEPMWKGGPSGPPSIKRVVIRNVTEWGTRLSMLQAGDADWIWVDPQYRPQLEPYAKIMCTADGQCKDANPSGYLTVYRDLPAPAETPAQMNWAINVEGGNPYVGSGQLDGNGIPPNFFADEHVRKAFNYCFDFQAMIKDALNGEGVQAQGPIIAGMMGYLKDQKPLYNYDPKKCEEEFKLGRCQQERHNRGDRQRRCLDQGLLHPDRLQYGERHAPPGFRDPESRPRSRESEVQRVGGWHALASAPQRPARW